MTTVLICGGRNFSDVALLSMTLTKLFRELHVAKVVTGAARGADTLGHAYAKHRGIPATEVKADWSKYGHAAGSRRNQQMLDDHPDIQVVIAFPGGTGTDDMVRRSIRAGVPITFRIDVDGLIELV